MISNQLMTQLIVFQVRKKIRVSQIYEKVSKLLINLFFFVFIQDCAKIHRNSVTIDNAKIIQIKRFFHERLGIGLLFE